MINTVGEDVTRPEAIHVSDTVTEERAHALLQTAIGSQDVAAEVLHIAHWRAEANVATRLREGRVFLAGDAAHVVPPNGGYGGNTGILDARNLAWKLAAVVKGEAGTGLLDSYDAERQPLGRLTVEQAYTRYATRVVPERGTDDAEPFIDDLTMELGLVVHSRAVVGDGSIPDGVLHIAPSEVRGQPGTRAPHVALAPSRSTLDLFGRGFVVLRPAGPGSTNGRRRAWTRMSSTRTGSPRRTASHPRARVSCDRTASLDGARVGRRHATNSPAHWTPSARGAPRSQGIAGPPWSSATWRPGSAAPSSQLRRTATATSATGRAPRPGRDQEPDGTSALPSRRARLRCARTACSARTDPGDVGDRPPAFGRRWPTRGILGRGASVLSGMFPANSHTIRPATAHDAIALRRLAAASGVSPLAGRILVAEHDHVVIAALSLGEDRTIAHSRPRALLRRHSSPVARRRHRGLRARAALLSERIREAVLGPRQHEMAEAA